ncbi:MAG TPA: hypothetical protein ENK70_05840 [Methylophaga sp.]|nr:hypothetical protein [Methylophaga sp.]
MAGYERQFNSEDGDKIDAELFINEYSLINDAFDNTIGHIHNGEVGNGGAVPTLANSTGITTVSTVTPAEVDEAITFEVDSIKQLSLTNGEIVPSVHSAVDIGTYSTRFNDAYIAGTSKMGILMVGYEDPTIPPDGTIIGINAIVDDGSFQNANASTLATQRSIKEYVDNQSGGGGDGGLYTNSTYGSDNYILDLTTGWAPYMTISITVEDTTEVHIHASVLAQVEGGEGDNSVECLIHRDGSNFMNQPSMIVYADGNVYMKGTTSILSVTTVPSGTHVFTLDLRVTDSTFGQAGDVLEGNMLILEAPQTGSPE